MKKFLFGAIAALFAVLTPADTQAQIAFFYKELPYTLACNENVEISVSFEYNAAHNKMMDALNPMLCLRVKNKSDKMLYIDLGNSFLTVNDEPRCYYTPSSTSTTEGRMSGAGVNLGLVSVGGGVSSSETTTTFSQRVVAVPPMSAKRLEPQQFLVAPIPAWGIHMYTASTGHDAPRCRLSGKEYQGVHKGQTQTFDPYDSLVRFSALVTCSFDEGCTETFSLHRSYYIDRLACYRLLEQQDVYEGRKKRDKLLAVFPEWDSWGDFFLLDGNY